MWNLHQLSLAGCYSNPWVARQAEDKAGEYITANTAKLLSLCLTIVRREGKQSAKTAGAMVAKEVH